MADVRVAAQSGYVFTMAAFKDTYLGRLRSVVGNRLILTPGARIVIEDRGRVLLQRRSDFGSWGLPGGNAEEGESLTSIIVREVEEEVGLQITSPSPFGFASEPEFETITFPNGDRCQFFVMLFFATAFEGIPQVADDESLAVEWFDPSSLPDMLPNMRRTVEAYLRFRASGDFQMI
jgi:8-oxo-dGTP pyrophosphatase MutT (NUDIX family)